METNCWKRIIRRRIVWRRKVLETNGSGDELLEMNSRETNCVETNSSENEK